MRLSSTMLKLSGKSFKSLSRQDWYEDALPEEWEHLGICPIMSILILMCLQEQRVQLEAEEECKNAAIGPEEGPWVARRGYSQKGSRAPRSLNANWAFTGRSSSRCGIFTACHLPYPSQPTPPPAVHTVPVGARGSWGLYPAKIAARNTTGCPLALQPPGH